MIEGLGIDRDLGLSASATDPVGDPSRQAVSALRGFAYQIYASALAWLSLGEGEILYLEVAEDYAVVAKNSLAGVQARDTAGSGAITIRNDGVIQTIDSLVDLTLRNPGRRVTIRYLTTSPIGRERAHSDRVANGALAGIGVVAEGWTMWRDTRSRRSSGRIATPSSRLSRISAPPSSSTSMHPSFCPPTFLRSPRWRSCSRRSPRHSVRLPSATGAPANGWGRLRRCAIGSG